MARTTCSKFKTSNITYRTSICLAVKSQYGIHISKTLRYIIHYPQRFYHVFIIQGWGGSGRLFLVGGLHLSQYEQTVCNFEIR